MKNRMRVIHGDITRLQVAAIVNAANTSLLGGGGVDGAIHRAAGQELRDACKRIHDRDGGCPTGEAVVTPAGKLPADVVIHTVGPVWHGGMHGEAQLLGNAYRNSLRLAEQRRIKSIAFPSISTGVYGYPKRAAAEVALVAVSAFLQQHVYPERVYFVCFDEENFAIYQQMLAGWQQSEQSHDN